MTRLQELIDLQQEQLAGFEQSRQTIKVMEKLLLQDIKNKKVCMVVFISFYYIVRDVFLLHNINEFSLDTISKY